ncbi:MULTISPECIES: hypothetical protein [unclassified Pseudomonas]|jgi:hypothetical protein|uniref:hypothetical protein n=1 Tax=Pseudomonas sp. Root329 TaxID=1736515 RepID=UPI000701A795|nr:hypothetical protein [Pseudomonas sp. Root329]KQV21990.1 hypothetical protein ASC74_16435 [Pseudomonas sp. Root329]
MSIGPIANWTIRGDNAPQPQNTRSLKANQMLQAVGKNPLALNVIKMDQMKLHSQIKGFDPENVTSTQLGKLSAFLVERGLISGVTAAMFANAGDKFDRFGVQAEPDQKFDALEYFATQLNGIETNNLKGNKYANYLIPEYKQAIYVLQNLKDYGDAADQTVKKKSINTRA